ncbi:MAG: Ig-like domain-containing protein, partial [Thermoplasmata archaeon]|nr:Ig-like domain-containing protein [Thermoplasmata archaeon]
QITRTFTFEPFANLSYSTTYKACFNASVALDTDGFYLDGNDNNVSEMHPIDTVCWTFRTSNTPSVMSTSPFPDETDVYVKENISIAFNEPMDQSSVESAFSMTDGFTTWDNSSFTAVWDAQSLVVTLSGFTFEFTKTYEVTIDASLAMSEKGVYLDGNMDGVPMGAPIDSHVWSFSTEPTPKVNGAPIGTDIALDANIVLYFNKIMDWNSVKSALTIREDYGAPVVIDSFGTTSFDNMALTFTVDPYSLVNGIPYTITLSGDLISGARDLNGNPLDGNKNDVLEGSPTDDFSWEFLTVAIDDVPPHVIDNYPSHGATEVQLDEKITITFSEQISETTFATGIAAKINMTTYSLEPFADSVWDTSSRTLTMTPHGGMDYDTEYTIIVSGDHIDGVKDLASNPLDGDEDGVPEGSPMDDHRFTFKTPDPFPPYVVNTTPYSDEEDVRQDTYINATFDDVMDETTLIPDNFDVRDSLGTPIDGNLTYNSQGRTLSFDPDGNLRPGMTHTVTISDVSDSDGNLIAAPYSWSFTTAFDYDPPVVTITTPIDGFEVTVGDELVISGTALDDSGIASLLIQFGDGPQIDITSIFNSTDGTWIYAWDTAEHGSGQVTINVTAYDLLLLRGSDEVSIQIKEKPAEDITWLILVILAVIIAVVATLLFILMWRRRRQAEEYELIAEEVREEMAEEREAEGEAGEEGEAEEAGEEPEETSEPIEIEEIEEVEEKAEEGPAPKLKRPVRRVKR